VRAAAPLATAVVAVTFWGMSAVIVRGISADAPATVFFRLWVSIPVWYLAMRVSGARLSTQIIRDAFPPALLFAASMAVSFESFKRTSIANASLIPSLQPALILLLASRLMGERRSNRELALAAVAFAGVVGVVLGGAKTAGASRLGDLLAVANLLLFTAYFFNVKRIRATEVPVLAYLTAMFLWSAVLISPWAVLSTKGLDRMAGTDWLLILALIVGPGLLGHGLMTWAQKYLDVTTTSLLNLASPVVSMIGARVFYEQSLKPIQMVAGAVVLFALAGIVLAQRTVPAPAPVA